MTNTQHIAREFANKLVKSFVSVKFTDETDSEVVIHIDDLEPYLYNKNNQEVSVINTDSEVEMYHKLKHSLQHMVNEIWDNHK